MRRRARIVGLIVGAVMTGWKSLLGLLTALGYADLVASYRGRIPTMWNFYKTDVGTNVLQLVGVIMIVAVYLMRAPQSPEPSDTEVVPSTRKKQVSQMAPEWASARILGPSREASNVIVLPIRNDDGHLQYVKARIVFSYPGEPAYQKHVKAGVWVDYGEFEGCSCLDIPRAETRHLILAAKNAEGYWAIDHTATQNTSKLIMLALAHGRHYIEVFLSAEDYEQRLALTVEFREKDFIPFPVGT